MGRGLGVAPPRLCRNITYIFSNKKNKQSGLKDMFSLIFSVKTNVDGYLMPVSSLFTKMSMLAVDLSIFRIEIHMYTDSYDNYFDLKKKLS